MQNFAYCHFQRMELRRENCELLAPEGGSKTNKNNVGEATAIQEGEGHVDSS